MAIRPNECFQKQKKVVVFSVGESPKFIKSKEEMVDIYEKIIDQILDLGGFSVHLSASLPHIDDKYVEEKLIEKYKKAGWNNALFFWRGVPHSDGIYTFLVW